MKERVPKELEELLGASKKEKRVFTPREIKELKTWCLRLEAVAQNISGDSSLRVHQGEPNTRLWYYNTIKNEAFFDPLEVLERQEGQEEVLLGSIAHEAGHAIISDFSFVPKSVEKQLGFSALLRSVEERPTDQVVRDKFPGAGKWVDQMRKTLAEEGYIQGMVKDRIGYTPYFAELMSVIVFYPTYSEEHKNALDQEVVDRYQIIKSSVEKIEQMTPKEYGNKTEKLELAKKRYKQTYKDIFPKLKELVEMDNEREKIRQVALSLLAQDMESRKIKTNNQQKESSVINTLPENLQEEMLSKILPPLRIKSEKWIQEMGEKGDETMLPTIDKHASIDRKLELVHALTATNTPKAYQIIPVPVDQFSNELQEELKNLFNEQAKEEQKETQKQIQETLEQIEDMINEILKGIMEKESLPTHKEIAEQEQEQELADKLEKSKQENKQKIESIRKEIEQNMSEVLKKSTYDEFYEQVREQDEALYHELYEIFYPSKKQKKKLKTTGSQLDIKALFNFISARKAGAKDIPAKIWETKTTPEIRDYAFIVLVDLSASMQFQNQDTVEDNTTPIQETLKALIVITEVLNRLGVKIEIVGFGDLNTDQQEMGYVLREGKIMTLKKIDEDLTDETRNEIATILGACGNTPTTKALRHAEKRMENINAKNKFITVLTDGEPNDWYDAKAQSDKIDSDPEIGLLGIGLGQGTNMVERLFTHAKGDIKINELTEVLKNIIVELIKNPTSMKKRD